MMLQAYRYRLRFLLCCLLIVICCLIPRSSRALWIPDSAQKPIIERALIFVQLLDQNQPLKAWSRATLYFRKKIPPQRWQRLYRNQRQRFGRPVARSLGGYRFYSTFEKALDGLYLEVRFRTNFQARADVIEQVMMYKDYDGSWRVIGYFMDFN